MSEVPLAPACRHCGATNDPGASECRHCHRGDWGGVTKRESESSASRRPGAPRSTFTGCMVVVTMVLIASVSLAFRAGLYAGLVIAILSAVIFALAIALFTICMAIAA